jgi:hypothetical protein
LYREFMVFLSCTGMFLDLYFVYDQMASWRRFGIR